MKICTLDYSRHSIFSGLKGLLVVSGFLLLPLSGTVRAQSGGTIESGMTIPVRTSEEIKVDNSNGRVFTGVVDEDVRDTKGGVALPKGTDVELLVRSVSNNEYALDLESVNINGHRFAVQAENSNTVRTPDGLGANTRTGQYVGGGAVIGAIIGAIAGGGKGAAIGGGVGAAAGATTQVLTRGKNVKVPPESLVTFRLEQRLYTGVADSGFSRNGYHYHSGYGTKEGDTAAYVAGLEAGRADRDRKQSFNTQTTRWKGADLLDYQEGYERGFDESPRRASQGTGSISIGANRYVTWKGPAASNVYVQVDDNPRRLFGSGETGNQPAPWITRGHKYVFTLEDPNGRELARDENDLRQNRAGVR